jgi:cysteine desulfurase
MGATLLSFSPHKFHGPKGVGVLYRHRRARLDAILHGGAQEGGRRAGVENVPAIVGAGVAAQIAGVRLGVRTVRTALLQSRLWEALRAEVPYLKLNGPAPGPERVTTNLNLSAEFVEGEGLLLMLDAQGIAVSSGTSCVSKALKVSPVLAAIGLEHSLAQGSIIVSLGADSSEADVDCFLEVFPKIVAKLRGMSPLWDEFQRGSIDSVLTPRNISSTPAAPAARR